MLVVTSAVIPFPKAWNALPRVRVAVSIDGLQAEHDAGRQPVTYAKIQENIDDRTVDISWVIANQMMERPGHLDEYLAFWSGLRQVERIWLSVYTPQRGEQSDEMLTADARRRLLEELPEPKHRFTRR